MINITGKENKILIDGEIFNGDIPGLSITIHGDNNVISLAKTCVFDNCEIVIGDDNCTISIAENGDLKNIFVRMCYGRGQRLNIGTNFRAWGVKFFIDEDSGVSIGNNCLFSDEIRIWPTDGHSILDLASGQIVNFCNKNLTIGSNVWVGQGVRITKNAQIPNNTVVGGGAVVSKKFEQEYTVIAGNPAKCVKTGITWNFVNPMSLKQ